MSEENKDLNPVENVTDVVAEAEAEAATGVITEGEPAPAAPEGKKPAKLSAMEVISYGLGGAASTMPGQFKSQFHMAFLTDIAGLPIGPVGTMIMSMTIWDAINDPVIGGIADRTNTKKWGKYRPHMMIGCIVWALILLAAFWVPPLEGNAKFGYYLVILCLFSVFGTMFTVPWQALNSVMSRDPGQRNLLLTSRQFAGFISAALAGIITLKIVGSFASVQTGWMAAAAVVGVVCIVTGLLCANGAKKVDYYNSIPTPAKVGFSKQLGIIFKNKAVVCAALMIGFVNLSSYINSALNMYYTRLVLKDMRFISYGATISLAYSVIFIPMMPMILKKLGKKGTLATGLIIQLSSPITLMIMRENMTLTIACVLTFVAGIGFMFSNVSTLAMIPDCTDYTEYKYHTSQAGMINASVTFMRKFGTSFSSFIVGTLLAVAGYDLFPDSMEVVNMILNIRIIAPFTLIALTLIVLRIYPLGTKRSAEIRAELAVRRAAAAAAAKEE